MDEVMMSAWTSVSSAAIAPLERDTTYAGFPSCKERLNQGVLVGAIKLRKHFVR